MLQLLETGRVLYALAAFCVLGILTRLVTRHAYKRLLKESKDLSMTKNKSLKELRQRAENTYRVNQGLVDSGAWLEHQLYDFKAMGIRLLNWTSLGIRLTWLCLLFGGACAFFSYWYRLDTYYVVMYGGGAVLMAMLTMLFDGGIAGDLKEQLLISLQDQIDNVIGPKMARNLSMENGRTEGMGDRGALRKVSRLVDRAGRMGRVEPEEDQEQAVQSVQTAATVSSGRREKRRNSGRMTVSGKTPGVAAVSSGAAGPGQADPAQEVPDREKSIRDADFIKRGLEQMAASREKNRNGDENWIRDLKPEEIELIGDILKQYLA